MPDDTNTVDPPKLLIVDDEIEQMRALCATLEYEGYVTRGFASANEALACLRSESFDLVITDLMMPEMDGITLVRAAREIDRDLVGVVMTGHGTISTAVEAMRVGAVDYILKPFSLSNILPVLARALHLRRVQLENIQLREAAVIYEQRLAISRGMDVETILRATADAAHRQSEQGEVAILLPTIDRQALEVGAARGPNEEALCKTRVPLDPSLQKWSSGVWQALADGIPQDSDLAMLKQHPLVGFKGIALPVHAHGELCAVLTFCPGARHTRITHGTVKTLNVLAGTAASALEAVTLLERLKGLNEDLERRVQERTRELELATRDVEAFSYSVSHDLRAPLTIAEGFCDLLVIEHGPVLPEEGLRLLNEARTGLARMRRLIEDMLAFAQLGHRSIVGNRVCMAEVVEGALSLARPQAGDRKVQLTVHELADCQGDASLLQQVVVNLLSNAFKFTAGKPDAMVEIGCDAVDDGVLYFVRDNGVGFDPRTAGKLFTAFQRLHSSREFPGTGIGLSIVQRIIERHGGRVWAEAAPNAGATFFFVLPRPRDERSASPPAAARRESGMQAQA